MTTCCAADLPEEIQSVMGHEMGHYVLGHIYDGMLFFFVLIVGGFAFLRWSLNWSLARWGEKWQIRDIGDTAVLPLVVLLASIFFCPDSSAKHLYPNARTCSGYVRTERQPSARWFRTGCNPFGRVSENESREIGGVDIL